MIAELKHFGWLTIWAMLTFVAMEITKRTTHWRWIDRDHATDNKVAWRFILGWSVAIMVGSVFYMFHYHTIERALYFTSLGCNSLAVFTWRSKKDREKAQC